jgi:hypothetical protein
VCHIYGRGVSQVSEQGGRNVLFFYFDEQKKRNFQKQGGVTPHAPPLFTLLIYGGITHITYMTYFCLYRSAALIRGPCRTYMTDFSLCRSAVWIRVSFISFTYIRSRIRHVLVLSEVMSAKNFLRQFIH